MKKAFIPLAIISTAGLMAGCGCITFSPDPLYGYDTGYSGSQGSQYPAGWEPAPVGSGPATQAQTQGQTQSQTTTSTQTTAISITGGNVPAAQQAPKPVAAAPTPAWGATPKPVPVVPAKSPAEPFFLNGEKWERKGNCPFTLLNYSQAVKLDRNYRPGRAQYGIGRCFVRMGDCNKAIQAFRDALSATIFADTPAIYGLLADCEMKQGQSGPAEETVRKGLLVHPNDPTLKRQKLYLDERKAPKAVPAPAPSAQTPAPAQTAVMPTLTPAPATPAPTPAPTPIQTAVMPTLTPAPATPAPAPAPTPTQTLVMPTLTPTPAPVVPATPAPAPVVLAPPVVVVPVPVEEVAQPVKPVEPVKDTDNFGKAFGKGKGKGNKKEKTNQGLHKGWDKNAKNAEATPAPATEPVKGNVTEPARETGEDKGAKPVDKDAEKASPDKPATPEANSPVPETKDVPGNPPDENPGNGNGKAKGKDK